MAGFNGKKNLPIIRNPMAERSTIDLTTVGGTDNLDRLESVEL
jgi:hypothetical protein